MRILLVSSSSGSRGGGELYLLYLAEALVARGHEVALWASSHERMDELAAAFSPLGKVHRSNYTNTYDHATRLLATCCNRSSDLSTAAEWRSLSPDVIHVNKQNLEDGLDLLRAVTHSGLPSLCTIHITQSARFLRARFAGLRDVVSRRALHAYPGLYVTVHQTRCDELKGYLPDAASRIRLVPNGVKIHPAEVLQPLRPEIRARLGLSSTQRLVVGLGRLVAQKGPARFLSFARQLHSNDSTIQFLWVGDGAWADQWDATVTRENMSGFVRRLPWQEKPLPYLAAADLFLHTAEYEGLPFALIEAMAARLPCAVTTNLARELSILDSGAVLPVEDASTVLSTLRDDSRLQACANQSIALASTRFSLAQMATGYEELYHRVLPSNAHSIL